MEKANFEEKQAYHESLKDYRDFKNAIDTAVEKAVEQALEKAVKPAVEKALEKKQIETAITCLENGIDRKTTSTITGLSIAQIEKIWKERQGQ